MAIEQETFAVGDLVGFISDDKRQKDIASFRQEYGEGPFPVIKAILIPPNKCMCGGETDDSRHHSGKRYKNCVPYRAKVGHHQLVTVKTQTGCREFSGAWLKKLKP